jgi:hypothetical protein
MSNLTYGSPYEKAIIELLSRIADSLESMRFVLATRPNQITAPTFQVGQAPIVPAEPPSTVTYTNALPMPSSGFTPNPNPFKLPETHPRRVLAQSEQEPSPTIEGAIENWKNYEKDSTDFKQE